MNIKIGLRVEQIRGLVIIGGLSRECVSAIVKKLSNLKPVPIKPASLFEAILDVCPEAEGDIQSVLDLLLSFSSIRWQQSLSVKELLDGIHSVADIQDLEDSEGLSQRWGSIAENLSELLCIPSLLPVVKGMMLSYDYANLMQTSNVLADIRPIYNDEGSEILGSVISFTLRVKYDSREGDKSLSIAMDKKDVIRLREACDKALLKASTSKKVMIDAAGISSYVSGEDDV